MSAVSGRRDRRAPARGGGQRHQQDEHDRERVDVAPCGVVGGALQREREQAQHDGGAVSARSAARTGRIDGGCGHGSIGAILSARERAVLIPKAQAALLLEAAVDDPHRPLR